MYATILPFALGCSTVQGNLRQSLDGMTLLAERVQIATNPKLVSADAVKEALTISVDEFNAADTDYCVTEKAAQIAAEDWSGPNLANGWVDVQDVIFKRDGMGQCRMTDPGEQSADFRDIEFDLKKMRYAALQELGSGII